MKKNYEEAIYAVLGILCMSWTIFLMIMLAL